MRACHKQLASFTLVESLMVLVVTAAFCLLPVLGVKSWQEEIQVKRFLNRFEKMVFVCQQIAIVEEQDTSIKNVQETQRMFLFYTTSITSDRPDPYPEDAFEHLVIPEFLTGGRSIREIKFLSRSGHPSRLANIRFTWPERNLTYCYQFQLGGGRFEKE